MDTGHTDYEIIHALGLEQDDGTSKRKAIENVVSSHPKSFDCSEVERWADEMYDSDEAG